MSQLTKKKFLSDDELEKVLRTCNKFKGSRDSIMIRFALFTGARSCEVLMVKKSDLNENGTVFLHGAKGSNNRTMPLPPEFFKELIAFFEGSDLNTLLFPVVTRTFRWIWSQYRPCDKGLHSLRHTFGVKLYVNCRDIHAVKTALGHKSIINTQIYVDFIENTERLKQVTVGMWGKAS